MTEDKTRSLIQGSLLKTSDGFTEKLMNQVELQKAKRIKAHFLLAFVACFALVFLVTKLRPEINLFHFHLRFAHRSIQIIGLLIILAIVNRLISLRREVLTKPYGGA